MDIFFNPVTLPQGVETPPKTLSFHQVRSVAKNCPMMMVYCLLEIYGQVVSFFEEEKMPPLAPSRGSKIWVCTPPSLAHRSSEPLMYFIMGYAMACTNCWSNFPYFFPSVIKIRFFFYFLYLSTPGTKIICLFLDTRTVHFHSHYMGVLILPVAEFFGWKYGLRTVIQILLQNGNLVPRLKLDLGPTNSLLCERSRYQNPFKGFF